MTGFYVEPTKSAVPQFTLKGVNLAPYVHCARIYESICKPYLTAQIILFDTNNLIENMSVVAGDEGDITLVAPPNGKSYSCTVFVLKMKGEQVPDTLKYQIYYIDFIGSVYYQDRGQTVLDKSFGNSETGTTAINTIWGQYLNSDSLTLKNSSAGPIGTMNMPYPVRAESPLTAIYSIMKLMVSSSFADTGSWLLFRDNTNVKLAQLAQLIADAQASYTEKYIQRETWGAGMGAWGGGFNDQYIYHGIIVAQMEAGRGDGGRSSGADIAAALSQKQAIFDTASGNIIGNLLATSPVAAAMSGALAGAQGALQGIIGSGSTLGGSQLTNSIRWPFPTMPATKTLGERSYSAMVKNGPQMTLKVPLQTGLNATVGQGIFAQLMPPTGDLTNVNVNSYLLAGNWLVTDLVHEVYTDEREVNGTTSMATVKGPMGGP